MLKNKKCLHIKLSIGLKKRLVVALCRHFHRKLPENNHVLKNLQFRPRGQMVIDREAMIVKIDNVIHKREHDKVMDFIHIFSRPDSKAFKDHQSHNKSMLAWYRGVVISNNLYFRRKLLYKRG